MKRVSLLSILSLFAVFLAAMAILVPSDQACADSWAMPTTTTIEAPLGEFRFTVEPAPIGSQLAYFAEEALALENGKNTERPAPLGLLERKIGNGEWEPVWAVPLVNAVAPVSILVADDGEHVVTFDNWHSVGHGDHVIVIYGREGVLVRSMSLNELLPQDYIDALPHTVSSVRWRESSEIDPDRDKLFVEVIVPSGQTESDTVAFKLSLSDGSVSNPEESEWAAAKSAASKRNDALRKAEEARVAYFTNPLRVPNGCEMSDWHSYVREAYYRLSPEGIDGSTATKILFPSDHERHQISVGWLVDAVAEELDFSGNIAAASPCSDDALVPAFAKAFDNIPQGRLTDTTLYVSTSQSNIREIERIVSNSGAKLVWLDPNRAIPQRPERIPGSDAKREADAARQESFFEELEDILDDF